MEAIFFQLQKREFNFKGNMRKIKVGLFKTYWRRDMWTCTAIDNNAHKNHFVNKVIK